MSKPISAVTNLQEVEYNIEEITSGSKLKIKETINSYLTPRIPWSHNLQV